MAASSNVVTPLSEPKKQYKADPNPILAPLGAVLDLIMFGGAMLLIFGQITTFRFSVELTLAAVIMVGMGIFVHNLPDRSENLVTLNLSNEGIIYRTPHQFMSTDWNNIERIELVPSKAGFTGTLIFRQPVIVRSNEGNVSTGPKCSALPLTGFRLAGANIASDIRHYAPHLFEK